MIVNTRDMFGCACKATYAIVNGKDVQIYKDPKTDTNHLKRSHKGLVFVEKIEDGFIATDGFNNMSFKQFELDGHKDAMHLVFKDGHLYNEERFTTIRERLASEK